MSVRGVGAAAGAATGDGHRRTRPSRLRRRRRARLLAARHRRAVADPRRRRSTGRRRPGGLGSVRRRALDPGPAAPAGAGAAPRHPRVGRSARSRPPGDGGADARARRADRDRGAAGRRAVAGAPSRCPRSGAHGLAGTAGPRRVRRHADRAWGCAGRSGHGAVRERVEARDALGARPGRADRSRLSGSPRGAAPRAPPGTQPVAGRRTAAGAPARRRPGVRAPARLPGRRRSARRVLDGDGAAGQARHPSLSPGAQPDGVDHARRQPPAARARRRSHQARCGRRRCPGAGPRRAGVR